MNWKNFISQSVGPETLGDVGNFITYESVSDKSPIDIFYTETKQILRSTPTNLTSTDWIGAAHFVIIVSLTENYFRTILGKILRLCPITKKNAAENPINFGSVLWHSENNIESGAFEHISFSESKKIIEITKKYIGVDINVGGFTTILEEFRKVCELRHAVVHSARYLAGKNALMLDIPPSDELVKIGIGYGQLQSAASICTTLVVSYNQKMFEVLCERWAIKWRTIAVCTRQNENELLKKIWKMFYSEVDAQDGNIPETAMWVKCRNLLKQEFNIL